MNLLYVLDNYIYFELSDGTLISFSIGCLYKEQIDAFWIKQKDLGSEYLVSFSDVGDWYDQTGTIAYTEATMRSFLRSNTGNRGASGGGGVASTIYTADGEISDNRYVTINGSLVFINNNESPGGIRYGGDYEDYFTDRSLVTKAYVDSDKTNIKWLDYVGNWKVKPTKVGTTTNGDIYEYQYEISTFYRLVPNSTSTLKDSFYKFWNGTSVSELIIERTLNI